MVVENVLFVMVIQGEVGYCFGLIIILIVEFGFVVYSWSIGGSGISIEVGMEEIFSFLVIDVNGCVGVVDLLVVEYVMVDL